MDGDHQDEGNSIMLRSRLTGIALISLGVGAAVVSLLGPLAFDVVRWRIGANTENQVAGQDVVTLVLVAPAAIVAGMLWLRGHRLAPVVTLGPALYGLYTFLSYILSPDYHRYAGNNENAFPLLLVLVILSWTTAGVAWSAIDRETLPRITDRTRNLLGGSLLLVGGLFVMAWSQQVAQVIGGSTALPEYLEDPGTFWVIKTFDLAFVMPVAIATGIGLLRNRAWAIHTAYAVGGFFTFMSAAVSAMALVMLARDDPAATLLLPAVTIPMTLVIGGLMLQLYRAYVPAGEPSTATGRHSGELEYRQG